jgi:acetyl esterase
MRSTARPRRRALALAPVLAALLLAGCSPAGSTAIDQERDIVYRTVAGERLTLDACTPQGATDAPMLVLVHGGSFTEGQPSDLAFICEAAAQHGYAAFSIGYRLLPASYPAPVEDVAAAIRWLGRPAQVERFGTDPDRIGVLGGSAGATILSELIYGTPDAPARPAAIKAAVLLSGVYEPLEAGDPLNNVAGAYAGCDLSEADCRQRILAIDAVDADAPPTLVMGSEEEFIPRTQAEDLAAALAAEDVPHELYLAAGDVHAEGLLKTDEAAPAHVWDFLEQHLR